MDLITTAKITKMRIAKVAYVYSSSLMTKAAHYVYILHLERIQVIPLPNAKQVVDRYYCKSNGYVEMIWSSKYPKL